MCSRNDKKTKFTVVLRFMKENFAYHKMITNDENRQAKMGSLFFNLRFDENCLNAK